MKSLYPLRMLVIPLVLSACNSGALPPEKPAAAPVTAAAELKILRWGPQGTVAGVNPLTQPDGSMGLWIEVSGERETGPMVLLFDGQPALTTAVQEKLVTAAIAAEKINLTGSYDVALRVNATGAIIPVGKFGITPR